VKRPEGFDERPERPAAPSAAPRDDSAPAPRGRLFGRRGARPQGPDDGQEARDASAADAPVDGAARSAGDLPDLPSVEDDAASGATRGSDSSGRARAGALAGAAGKRFGAGLSSVAERLRELSPDEDYRDPDAADRRPGGDRSGGVTDVIDLDRASRPDDHADDASAPIGAGVRAAETAREARGARKRRRLLERAEIRRFTRRSRHRRVAWITAGSLVLVLVLSVLVAVYSPLMALRTIDVKGASRVDATEVRRALSDQLGTPLARLDFGEVKKDLAAFPLIESYVTEEAPPNTLVVTITERTPIVAVQSGSGYDLVDPAGIVVQSMPKRPDALPVADVRSTQLGSSVFRTMTEVVLALPSTVRAQTTEVTASTADDVTLTMRDGSKVVWGSPDASDRKAALLAALVKDHDTRAPGTKVEYDVSAPDNGIIRSQS
jgi:cell division protein FtsQ